MAKVISGTRAFCKLLILCLCCVAGSVPFTSAQTLTGEIDITVVDQTGAVVPHAQVTITRTGTESVVRSLGTNDEGVARGSLLDPGAYDITVEMQGFKKLERKAISLGVAQVLSLQLVLEPGAVTQLVTVVGRTPQLEEKSASLAQVVDQRQILELPLNGRNYLDLGRLVAGAVPSRGSRDQTFSAYGNNGIQNAFVLDGARNNNYLRGLDNRARDELRPPLDALQEFSVQTSNFSAEYGASAGAVVLTVTRSGTNHVHGSAYEFHRNSKLDARDFFAPPGPKPVFIRNQFGGALGGPIKKDRAWIFGAYERTSNRDHASVRATVPTLLQRQGIFDVPIFNPLTTRLNPRGTGFIRDPFPQNTIRPELFDPIGKALVDRYPLPNLPRTTNNFTTTRAIQDTTNNGVWRGDLQLSAKDSFFGRYSLVRTSQLGMPVLPPPAQTPVIGHITTNGVGFGYTRTVSPTVINEARFSWTRLTLSHDATLPRDEIVRGSLDPQVKSSLPSFGPSGFPALGDQPPDLGNNPLTKSSGVWDTSDNISWSKAKHLVKLGFEFQIIRPSTFATLSGRGSFGFTGVFTQNPQNRAGTGSSVADLLLGVANSVSTGTVANSVERGRYQGFYAQDRWSLTPNLTLTLGLRYELFYPYTEVQNRMANFILDDNDPLFGQLIQAGDSRKPRALVRLDKNTFAPRVGLAYRVPQVKGLVIRAAYGIFYAQDEGVGVTNRMTNNPPFFGFGGQSIVSDQLFPSSGFILSSGSLSRPAPIDPKDFVLDPKATFALRSWDQRNVAPYVQEWNFSIQKQLPWNLVWEINYVGNIGVHLTGSFNPNQPLAPGPGSPNNRRPLAQLTHASVIRIAPFNRSAYEGISTRLQKEFSGGVSFMSAFTYGHSIDLQNEALDVCDGCGGRNGFPNNYNLEASRASSDNDARLRYTFSGIWSLPFGAGRRFVNAGAASKILGGWSMSGIWQAQSGFPLTVNLPFDNTNVGATSRPDRFCAGSLGNATPERWFDTSCFVAPLAFTFGNSGRNVLKGPGLANLDLTAAREFHVGFPNEAGRLQFRSDFFNIFNHPHFGEPGTSVGTPTFGVISSTSSPNRQIQFALRWVF